MEGLPRASGSLQRITPVVVRTPFFLSVIYTGICGFFGCRELRVNPTQLSPLWHRSGVFASCQGDQPVRIFSKVHPLVPCFQQFGEGAWCFPEGEEGQQLKPWVCFLH